ncbi:MAG: hypothetical protein KDJ67_16455 [Nitratireductor sp.]|nr:hypothetical protein [Nitratireductor sp.]
MTMFIIQSALLLAIAYILGCILGCFLHRMFAEKPVETAAVASAAVAASAATAVAPRPAPASVPAPAPEPVKAPEPTPAPMPVVSEPVAKAKPRPRTAAKKPAAARTRTAKAAPMPAAPAARDDLKRIRGIGRQNEARLNAVGVNTFTQIAAWSKKDQAEMGERLAFPGRIEREEWVRQAKVLAKGGQTEFSKRVAKGEVATSTGKGTANLGKKPPLSAKPKGGKGDNLTLIDGVGNAIEKKLQELGVWHFAQIAKWTADHQVWIGNEIGFPGRPERENWVGEAKILAAGGMTEHAKRVEAGEITTSRKSKPSEK